MPPKRYLTLEDIHLAQSPQGLLNLFGRLGYSVEREVVSLNKNDVGFATADLAALRNLYLLADQGGQLQVILFELEEVGLARLRSLAGNMLSRGGNYLIVATQDYHRITFVNPGREGNRVKIRKLVVDTSHPTRHDLDVLDGLAVNGQEPKQLYRSQCEAFNVERVTDDFYREYAELFKRVHAALKENNKGVRAFYDEQYLHSFTQRLLGRMMFLHFIQKKGWLAGDTRFLENQFHKADEEKSNYYSSVLEPLFFDTLNKRRANNKSQWGVMPYLNGGLFEKEYDFMLHLPNEVFSSDLESGLLTFFRNYNFTVAEDTPAEQEVAIDPEMLGKVFENLMEEQERGKSGTFYTPRPIVHYMCREALLGYLTEQTALPRPLIAAQFDDEPADSMTLSDAHLIETALDEIRVLDPAVGTGAFLVGILHELVTLRRACEQTKGSVVPRSSAKVAEWKRQFISKSLYGVDIKSEAIEIAKLRLWLSLVVDLELRYVEPLPNLEYKLRVGNSLLETVEGEKILPNFSAAASSSTATAQTLPGFTGKGEQLSLDMGTRGQARQDLAKLKEKFFAAQDEERKALRRQIEAQERELVNAALDEKIADIDTKIKKITDKGSLANWQGMAREQKELDRLIERKSKLAERQAELLKGAPLPFFLYRLHFYEVFREKDGFDIVIANPPYVRHELISDQKPDLKANFPDVYDGMADLYVYFYARGLDLLHKNGMLSFISSNKFMRAGYGKNLRQYLTEKTTIQSIIDIGDLPVFEAIAYPCIVVTSKALPREEHSSQVLSVKELELALHLEEEAPHKTWKMHQHDLRTDGWNLQNTVVLRLIEKLRATGTPLTDVVQGCFYRGMVTGSNEAFVIDEATRKKIVSADPKSVKIIKPWLRGRDIKKWEINWEHLYLLYIPWDFQIEKYPAVKTHLKQYQELLSNRPEVKQGNFPWFALSRFASEFVEDFNKPKIIYQEIATSQAFTYTESPFYLNNKCYFIPTTDLYLLGVLNSKIAWFILGHIVSKLQQGAYALQSPYMSQFPVPTTSTRERTNIAKTAKRLLELRGAGEESTTLETELNERVYRLFGLSKEEQDIIQGKQ
jgi:adenine-specific DNA-methyltransferase